MGPAIRRFVTLRKPEVTPEVAPEAGWNPQQQEEAATCKLLEVMVGERGLEPPTPWSRTKSWSKSKCFIRCCLRARKPFLLSPQLYRRCTEQSRNTSPRPTGKQHTVFAGANAWQPPPDAPAYQGISVLEEQAQRPADSVSLVLVPIFPTFVH